MKIKSVLSKIFSTASTDDVEIKGIPSMPHEKYDARCYFLVKVLENANGIKNATMTRFVVRAINKEAVEHYAMSELLPTWKFGELGPVLNRVNNRVYFKKMRVELRSVEVISTSTAIMVINDRILNVLEI